MSTIYIASDHAGFELKNQITDYLKSKDYKVEDCGPHSYDKNDDYPDFIIPCATKVSAGNPEDKGIILGMSGQGEAIAANKIKGVRAALYYGYNLEIIKLSRQHNNANVLSIGAKFISFNQVKEAIDLWLTTKFEGGRHERRIKKIG
ncbi:MAG: RpiB/LacA/LacB family sugar-phosphate isomerase [Patescibacteria group bacterium]|jgi:ribose 5-phosphate isomerase B